VLWPLSTPRAARDYRRDRGEPAMQLVVPGNYYDADDPTADIGPPNLRCCTTALVSNDVVAFGPSLGRLYATVRFH
jgi:hypothetical protein